VSAVQVDRFRSVPVDQSAAAVKVGRMSDIARRRATIDNNSPTEVLRFTVSTILNSRHSLSANFDVEFRFQTRRNDTNYMGSRVRLRFSVLRTLDQNTVLGAPTFVDAVVSQEIGTNADHTALDASQFSLAIVSGSATEPQIVALSFTNAYNAQVNNSEAMVIGTMTCAGGSFERAEGVSVTPDGD
jgi:hypothetical protein